MLTPILNNQHQLKIHQSLMLMSKQTVFIKLIIII